MSCISLFYDLFYQLEDDGLLNMSSNTDLFALHYIFIPRINRQLDVCRDFCSHHSLCTARNRSPLQRWLRGMMQESGDEAALQGTLVITQIFIIHGVPKKVILSLLDMWTWQRTYHVQADEITLF